MIEVKKIEPQGEEYQRERELRNRILLRPIGIPDYGWEKKDDTSHHFVAIHKNEVIGCVLLWPDPSEDGAAQLLQMAVETDHQGRGVGRLMIQELIEFAQRSGLKRVWCHARVSVETFYRKLGFAAVGEVFQEADIDHRIMETLI